MGEVVALKQKVFQVRCTESNAHFLGIMMGASVKRNGGKLVVIRHDMYLEIPLGHWIILKDGTHTVQAIEPVEPVPF